MLHVSHTLTDRLSSLGLLESAYSRSRAIGYMPIHTRVMVPNRSNPSIDDVSSELLRLNFTPLPTSHHDKTTNVRFSSYVNRSNIHVIVLHSEDGEVVSATIQYLSD